MLVSEARIVDMRRLMKGPVGYLIFYIQHRRGFMVGMRSRRSAIVHKLGHAYWWGK